jgi:Tol biopolymer transport system component
MKYWDVTFSPDGNFIYFRIDAFGTPNRTDLYRIPVLGGHATRVVEDVDAPVNFIAGGQPLCIYRQDTKAHTYKFLSASVDGGDEQVLTNGKMLYLDNPAFAPNGRFAVFVEFALGLQSLEFASGSRQVQMPRSHTATGRAIRWMRRSWPATPGSIRRSCVRSPIARLPSRRL